MEFCSDNNVIKYVSVLGLNFRIGKFEKLGVFDEKTSNEIIKYLDENNTETIVFDCSSMVYKDDQKVFERLFNTTRLKDRKIVLFNIELELHERAKKDLRNSMFKHKVNASTHSYFESPINYIEINDVNLSQNIIDNFRLNDINILKDCADDHNANPFQLLSTPFWTNYHFNISKLFNEEPLRTTWILARLCDKFRKSLRYNKSVLLVSSSLYGTILSTLMKELLNDSYKIETICFDRVGPDLLINEVSNHRKEAYDYIVHICDFIIGGTELKILKALLSIRKLSITHVFAIGTRKENEDIITETAEINKVLCTNDVFPDIYYSLIKPQVK